MLLRTVAVVVLFAASGLAIPEITDEIRKQFEMGLFPRVVTNLQVRPSPIRLAAMLVAN